MNFRTSSDYQNIVIDESYAGQVAIITLSAPPANILSADMMAEISDFFEADKHNKLRKLIIFKGAGDSFCFGASVEEHTAERVHDMLPGFHKMIGTILSHPVATLAQVSGYCLGGGFELALACSFIFADETAKFAVPEIQLGVFPPVAASLLPALGGGTITNEMLLTGKKLSSDSLDSLGIVTEVSAHGELQDNINAYIEKRLIPNSASSLRFAHQAARLSLVNHYNETIPVLEKMYLDGLMITDDANEGINAFIEKRKPKWVNK